jgi:hypothetical protein
VNEKRKSHITKEIDLMNKEFHYYVTHLIAVMSRITLATKIVALPQKAAIEQRTTNNEQRSFLCDSAREIILVACLSADRRLCRPKLFRG